MIKTFQSYLHIRSVCIASIYFSTLCKCSRTKWKTSSWFFALIDIFGWWEEQTRRWWLNFWLIWLVNLTLIWLILCLIYLHLSYPFLISYFICLLIFLKLCLETQHLISKLSKLFLCISKFLYNLIELNIFFCKLISQGSNLLVLFLFWLLPWWRWLVVFICVISI